MRIGLDETFIRVAKVMALRSPCLSRQVGCVITDEDDHILSTGYNGPPRFVDHCKDVCRRVLIKDHSLDACMAVHAEQNALLQCPDVRRIRTVYVTHSPCMHCVKMIMNTECRRIVFAERYPDDLARDTWIGMHGSENWTLLSI